MKRLTHNDKNSQELNHHFIGGLLFSVPRFFWILMDTDAFSMNHLSLKKALVAGAIKSGQNLFLIDAQKGEIFSPLNVLKGQIPFVFCNQNHAKRYFDQALVKLGFNQKSAFPPLSLITARNSHKDLPNNLKKIWEKELGIDCSLCSFGDKVSDKTLQLAVAQWSVSSKEPLLMLTAFKKATDQLKPIRWEHPGYHSLFEKVQKETNPEIKEKQIQQLEEMILEYLPILPLFYGNDPELLGLTLHKQNEQK